MFINVPIESAEHWKKRIFLLYVNSKVEENLGDEFCPTCKNEKYIYVSTNKILISTTANIAKPAFTWLIFHSGNKKQHWLFRWRWNTLFWKTDKSPLRKELQSPLLNDFLRQSEPTTAELELKKDKIMHERVELPMAEETRGNFHFHIISFYTFLSNIQAAWSSQFLTWRTTGLSTLVQFSLSDSRTYCPWEETRLPKNTLLARDLFLCQRQRFVDKHFKQTLIKPTQHETIDMREGSCLCWSPRYRYHPLSALILIWHRKNSIEVACSL